MRAVRMTPLMAAALIAGSGGSLAAQTLQPASTVKQTPTLDIFAGGNVKDVLGGADNAAAVSGTMGLRYRGKVFVVSSLINIAGTTDTLRSDLAASLLQPAIGKALNAGLLEMRAPRLPRIPYLANDDCDEHNESIPCHIGARAYLSASSALWQRADTPIASDARVVPSWGSGLGISYTFVNGTMGDDDDEDKRKPVAMIFDLGWATRHLRGDLAAEADNLDGFIGSSQRNFNGLEAGLTLQYDLITAGITYYRFGGDLAGFSHGQLVAGASIQTSITSGTYNHH